MKINRILSDNEQLPSLAFESWKDIGMLAELPPSEIIPTIKSLEVKKIIFVDWDKKQIRINSNYKEWIGYDAKKHEELKKRNIALIGGDRVE